MFEVLILSFIQGVTEFLPISSTGHLVLISKFYIPPIKIKIVRPKDLAHYVISNYCVNSSNIYLCKSLFNEV